MTTSELAYPVLEMNTKGEFDVSSSEEWLTTMFAHDLRPRCSRIGHTVVNSNGRAAEIVDGKFVRGKGRLWGYTIFFDRMVTIELTLGEPYEMSLDELKSKVLRRAAAWARCADPGSWREIVRPWKDASAMRELIDSLLPGNDRRIFFR